jgi:hypothetical protein
LKSPTKTTKNSTMVAINRMIEKEFLRLLLRRSIKLKIVMLMQSMVKYVYLIQSSVFGSEADIKIIFLQLDLIIVYQEIIKN